MQSRHVLAFGGSGVVDDLVREVAEVLTGVCARLYGRRSVAGRTKAALKAVEVSPG